MYEKFGWKALAKSPNITGPREHYLTIGRYVDDVFVASRWFCPCCVKYIVTSIYGRTINFDEACDEMATINGYITLKFLDLWCYLSWDSHFFGLVNKNDLYSITGLASLSPRIASQYPMEI